MSTRAAAFAYFDAPPLALAHRGGTAYGPNLGLENTLTAFGNAVALGYRYLETDVHATADGVLLAFHDTDLDRVTDATGAIADLPYAAVREARVGGRERIPRLVDLVEAFPGVRLNLDVKADSAFEGTLDLIERLRLHDRVCLGSFSERRIRRIRRRLGPTVATAAGQAGTAAMALGPVLLSRLVHTAAPVFQVPEETDVRGRRVRVVHPRMIRTAHALGKQVHVWFHPEQEQSAQVYERLLDLGVDGIVADRIDVLADVLAARGQWVNGPAAGMPPAGR